MKILNIHSRIIDQPKKRVAKLFETLATEEDKIWPTEKWPAMKFDEGIKIGAKGGHGPIRYSVEHYQPENEIRFRFSRPLGFNGVHRFEIKELEEGKTEVKHTIDMRTSIRGTLLWVVAIRALHDALIEDAFDKLENNFSEEKLSSSWSPWVRFLRQQIAKRL